MVAEPPKFVVIGGEELTMTETDELIGIFNMPGWRVFSRILANHKLATADGTLGEATPKTLQDLGIAQGSYGTCSELLDLPREASQEREKFVVTEK